jgi:hypothetical protein
MSRYLQMARPLAAIRFLLSRSHRRNEPCQILQQLRATGEPAAEDWEAQNARIMARSKLRLIADQLALTPDPDLPGAAATN